MLSQVPNPASPRSSGHHLQPRTHPSAGEATQEEDTEEDRGMEGEWGQAEGLGASPSA